MISEPFFLETPAARLFAVHHRPAGACRGHVLCVPGFNEEMNRCRSMVTLQARAFAAEGYGTLVLDLFGTGDSDGGFVDARWPLWLDNLRAGQAWLQARPGGCRALWGIRLGAVLAASLHAATADPGVALLLWQPVLDGKTHLTQFLRVRIAASMDRTDIAKETTASMRDAWKAGRTVEVAGYEIHPELAASIDAEQLARHDIAAGSRMLWLEHAADDAADLAPASRTLLSRWPGPDVVTSVSRFGGPAFWQVHERVVAPQAIERTIEWTIASGIGTA